MTKFIVVQGPGGSGKTSAIKAAVSKLGIDFSRSPVADIECITKARVGTRNVLLGVCSSGDQPAIIRRNVEFLRHHTLDFAIFACRTKESGLSLIRAFATAKKAKLVVLPTKKLTNPREVRAHLNRITDALLREIRDY